MDLRRPSDRVNAETIRSDYLEAADLLREAEDLAELYVSLTEHNQ